MQAMATYWFMPAFVKSSVGSSCGMVFELAQNVCCVGRVCFGEEGVGEEWVTIRLAERAS